jgi:hypothetical protein
MRTNKVGKLRTDRSSTPKAATATPIQNRLGWLTLLTTVFALLSIVSALFGYGVALGLSSYFGLGAGSWYSSSLELVGLTGEGFIGILAGIDSRLVENFVSFAATFGIASTLAVLFAWPIGWYLSRNRARLDAVFANAKGGLLTSPGESHPQFREAMGVGLKAAGVVGVATFGSFFIGALVLALTLAVLAYIPTLGMSAGVAYAREVVMKPAKCISAPGVRARHEKSGKAVVEEASDWQDHCGETNVRRSVPTRT